MATGRDRNEFPQPPEGIEQSDDHSLFLELNEVILKACEDVRDRRYQRPADLTLDLKTALAGKSVRQKRVIARVLATTGRVGAVLTALALLGFLVIKAFGPAATEEAAFPAPTWVPFAIPETDLQLNFHRLYHDFSPDGKRIIFVREGGLFLH
jgi:hypothetical protein